MQCTHEEYRQVWVPDYNEEDWPNQSSGHYERHAVTLYKDLDIHRYQCSGCGKIGYYSGAARDYYEKGVPNEAVEFGINIGERK